MLLRSNGYSMPVIIQHYSDTTQQQVLLLLLPQWSQSLGYWGCIADIPLTISFIKFYCHWHVVYVVFQIKSVKQSSYNRQNELQVLWDICVKMYCCD